MARVTVDRALIALPLLAAAFLALPVHSADAATVRLKYSPLDADGTLRDGLSVASGGIGECTSGSYIVVGAFRCFEDDSSIWDVCYLDQRDVDLPSLLCVSSPWARAAVRLQYIDEPDPRFGARPGGPPWALELASGRRCVWASRASTTVGRLRLNYLCGRFGTRTARFLFGTPDKRRAVWRIRLVTTPAGGGMRKVAIKVAWR